MSVTFHPGAHLPVVGCLANGWALGRRTDALGVPALPAVQARPGHLSLLLTLALTRKAGLHGGFPEALKEGTEPRKAIGVLLSPPATLPAPV